MISKTITAHAGRNGKTHRVKLHADDIRRGPGFIGWVLCNGNLRNQRPAADGAEVECARCRKIEEKKKRLQSEEEAGR